MGLRCDPQKRILPSTETHWQASVTVPALTPVTITF